jgi:hypothetical protein
MEIVFMKYTLLGIFLVSFILSFKSSANTAIDRAIYLECETCYTTSDFVAFGKNNFENNYADNLNQQYKYTIVNHSAQLAVFVNFKHVYRPEPEPDSHLTLDIIIPSLLTADSEMNADYFLSRYVIQTNRSYSSSFSKQSKANYAYEVSAASSNGPQTVEITISGQIGSNSSITMGQYRGQISSALKSNVGGGVNWAKLAGRTIIIVNFDNGKLGAFFSSIYSQSPYQYLNGTAVDKNGNPISMSGGASSGGGSGGVTSSGSGSWTIITGGAVACTSINGGSPMCEWIRF